jgi:DNA invertase Pin-like site-specific DNA recombinase
LAAEFALAGKSAYFETLKRWLVGDIDNFSQAEAGHQLGLTEGAVKVAIHRLRKQFRELVKSELAQTVETPEQVQEELNYLLEVLSRYYVAYDQQPFILMLIEKMAKAYSYIRFSTAIQSQGDSMRRQTELSAQYAAQHGLALDQSLTLHDEGLSGFTGENRTKGALAVFLKAVESGLVPPGSFLLVESLDRLSRDTLSQQMTLFMGLINSDIIVVTLTDGQVYSRASIDADFTKLMMSLVVMMRSHEESLMKSRRLKAVWDAKRKNASAEKLTGQCPAWLKLNADRKSFSLIDERVAIIRRIFQMSLDGVGHHTIVRTLNSEGIQSWGRRNTGWHVSYVRSILQSKVVLGEYQPYRRERGEHRVSIPEGTPIPNYYPAVIDLATWQTIKDRRKSSTPGRVNTKTVNLFSGLAYDAEHACPMRFMSRSPRRDKDGKRQGRWHYLVSDYGRKQTKETAASWRYEWFEAWFLDYVCRLDWNAVDAEKTPSAELTLKTRHAKQRSELENIEQSLNRLVKLASYTDNAPRAILSEMSNLEIQKHNSEKALLMLEREIQAAEIRRNGLTDSAGKIAQLVSSGNAETRLRLREEIRRKIERIDIYPHGASDAVLATEHLSAPGWPCFRITFVNGATRWVLCDGKKPVNRSEAALSDTVTESEEYLHPYPDPSRKTTAAELLKVAEKCGSADPAANCGHEKNIPKPQAQSNKELAKTEQGQFLF